jgi:hypothetical protein
MDHRPDSIEILQNIVIPKADQAEALALKMGCPIRVAVRGVLAAVDLDDEAPLGAEKIDDVAVDLELAAEFEGAELPIAKDAPELALSVGGVPTKLACPACKMMSSFQTASSPRRDRADPLPQWGEGFCGIVNA